MYKRGPNKQVSRKRAPGQIGPEWESEAKGRIPAPSQTRPGLGAGSSSHGPRALDLDIRGALGPLDGVPWTLGPVYGLAVAPDLPWCGSTYRYLVG